MYYLDTINILDKGSGLKHTLPEWAKFYHALGVYSSIKPTDHLRKVVTLSVPTRHFCGSMIATGAISHAANRFVQGSSSKESHFNKLINLPVGTGIIKRDPGTKKIIARGKSVPNNDPTLFRIRTNQGTLKTGPLDILLSKDLCWEAIEIDISNNYKLPVGQKNTFTDDGANFRSNLFDNNNADHFFKSPNETICLLIGELSTLKNEMVQENFIISEVDAVGSIQDIIRADKLNKDSGYKTRLLSDRLTSLPLTNEPPRLVIFDGARAFSKWKHSFTKSNMVIILDRTDLNYEEGVLSANQDFEDRKEDLNMPDFLIEEIPQGVKVMSCCLVVL